MKATGSNCHVFKLSLCTGYKADVSILLAYLAVLMSVSPVFRAILVLSYPVTDQGRGNPFPLTFPLRSPSLFHIDVKKR